MKENIFILLLLLLTTLPLAAAESPNGTIPFDCPDVPNPKFQFHFTRELISLAVTTFPFNTVENIYIHIYDDKADIFHKFVQYYVETLEAENWHNSHEDSTTRLYILERPTTVENQQADNAVLGLFALVQSDNDVYLLNIVGNVPLRQARKLLTDLGDIGIDIPELKSIGELSLPKPEEPSAGMPLPTLFRMRKDSASANKTDSALFSTSFEENHQGHWTYRGHPIERIQIRSSDIKHVTVVSSGLKNGPEDITGLLDGLSSNTDSREIPKFIVLPSEKTITITAGNMSDETQPTTLTKVFQTGDGDPIHEIVIRGNQYTEANTVRAALEKGPAKIGAAVDALPDAVPTFERVEFLIEEVDSQRTAIITAIEKPPALRFYTDGAPHLGSNRVTGWELGVGIESGFRVRKEHSSAFTFGFSSESAGEDNSKLFGQMGYGFSDKQPYYRLGGRAIWEEPYSWQFGLTAQFQRATSITAPDLFSHYNDTATLLLRMFGVPDHQDYYLRHGVEVELEWKAVFPMRPLQFLRLDHSFKLILLAESHDSLQKSTDWHLFNWGSKSEVRENPLITPGQMRSAMFRYDFDTRNNYFGSHHTFFVEHSNPAFGSDFNWTRFQAHLRYAYPLGDHQIRARAVVGSATAPLPIQRQFVMGGIGTLNGYPLYAFAGDAGFLLNTEFIYQLFSFGNQSLAAAFIFDGGQVWNLSENQRRFDPKGSVGIGLQFETDVDIFRFNVAKAFDAEQEVRYNFMFFYSF
ncbi:BamA/TamA family outer membrane protein [Candidatus Poribacteria bacterium]|nr:BamA/TamA family outer membrane protein [Candidatus Poribacteria bacterium]